MNGFGTPVRSDIAQSYKDRVIAALERHAEKTGSIGGDSNYTTRRSFAGTEPTKPAKKADFNGHTKDHYVSLGYAYSREDYYDSRTMRNHDFLGFADGIAMHKSEIRPLIAVQLTSAANIKSRVRKILENKLAFYWSLSGNHIEVIGWEKKGKCYVPIVVAVRQSDFKTFKEEL